MQLDLKKIALLAVKNCEPSSTNIQIAYEASTLIYDLMITRIEDLERGLESIQNFMLNGDYNNYFDQDYIDAVLDECSDLLYPDKKRLDED